MTDKEYYELIQPYEDAMKLLLTRLEVLNHSIYKTKTGKPVHNIQYRIKKKDSIEEKLVRHGFEPTLENAKDQLQDIAGVRIICYFVGDVNNLVNMLKKQPDLIFIRESNYIENPKPNGYRSHHVILGVNVCCLDANEYYPVEIQLRTISMDFWVRRRPPPAAETGSRCWGRGQQDASDSAADAGSRNPALSAKQTERLYYGQLHRDGEVHPLLCHSFTSLTSSYMAQ